MENFRKIGNDYYGLCPFCRHHNRRLSINIEKKVFKCWHCNKSGKLSKIRDQIELNLSSSLWSKESRNTLQLKSLSEEGHRYLRSRGVTDKHIQDYSISEGINDFSGRVIFPIFAPSGSMVQFCARAYRENIKPKYLFGKKGEWLKISSCVFGLRQMKNPYICEGVFDAIAVKGLAVFGKKISKDQERIIKTYISNPVVCFHNDAELECMKAAVQLSANYCPTKDDKDWDEIKLPESSIERSQIRLNPSILFSLKFSSSSLKSSNK